MVGVVTNKSEQGAKNLREISLATGVGEEKIFKGKNRLKTATKRCRSV